MRRLNFLKNMRRSVVPGVCAALLVLASGAGGAVEADAAAEYYIGGMTAGFALPAGGTEIVELTSVTGENGVRRPAEEAGLKAGDLICAADGIAIESIEDLTAALARSGGNPMMLTVLRGGERLECTVLPVKDVKSDAWKMGVLIRDMLSGIGTITYIEKGSRHFGALGHGVSDGPLPDAASAKVFACSVIGVNKGTRGRAGELKGLFLNDKVIAHAELFCGTGLFGTFDKGYDFSACETAEIAPVSEATIGKAVIYSTIDGTSPKAYDIAIAKVDAGDRDNKNFVIKVTDEELIEATGGIVQGMSGSPVVQDGKLVGAVTHVLVGDPTRGYAVALDKMLEAEKAA